MSQPVFRQRLEEDTVQRVGTKLCLEVTVEDTPEKVFFEWRGPTGSSADDGRVRITETGSVSTAEISPLHLQVIVSLSDVYIILPLRTRDCGPARLKISMASHKQAAMSWPRVRINNSPTSCHHPVRSPQELQGPGVPGGAGGGADGAGDGVTGVQGGWDPLALPPLVQGRGGDPLRRRPGPHSQHGEAGVRVQVRRRQLHGDRLLHLRPGRVQDPVQPGKVPSSPH